tara:strand:+ start:731 stop:2308 length:1578 start_codon:yes stop_codon:yes gene_type:complete
MSYRNPQQYGIVEDMTAGTRAFQKGFGQVQNVIEKRKKEREEGKIKEGVNEDRYLEGIKEATKNAEGLEIGSTNAVEEFANLYIKDGFFKDKSVAERRKALNNIEKSAGLGGALETTLTEFQAGSIDFENPATEKWLQETKNLGDKAFSVDKETKQLMVNGMTWATATAMLNKGKIAVQGDAGTDAKSRKALQIGADKMIESAMEKKGSELTDEEKRAVVKKYVSAQSDIISNPNQHHVWKNKISNNSSFFEGDNPDKDDITGMGIDTSKISNYQGTSYNASEIEDPEERNKFLIKRQEKLVDYYTNIIAGVEPDQRLMTRYEEENLKTKKLALEETKRVNQIKANKDLNEEQTYQQIKQALINKNSPYIGGKTNKPKNNAQLTQDLGNLNVDGLFGKKMVLDENGTPLSKENLTMSGSGYLIRAVKIVGDRGVEVDAVSGATDNKFLVKLEVGKVSGGKDNESFTKDSDQEFIIDLNDPKVQNQLNLTRSSSDAYSDFTKKLKGDFLPKANPNPSMYGDINIGN